MIISQIVAAGEKNEIGGQNKLLWHLPNDLKFFKNSTWGMPVIMGRKTYEFGYRFGLIAGQQAYPHMTHYIFSNSLTFEEQHPKVQVKPIKIEEIEKLKLQNGPDIYLCGGGQFAGWLLDNHQIDILKIKLNPLILGEGIKLFGDSRQSFKTELIDTNLFDNGLQIMTYKISH